MTIRDPHNQRRPRRPKAKFAWIAGIVLVLVAVAAAVLVMSDRLVSGKWRYRSTIAVETPERVRTGSAVREVSATTGLIRWYDGGGGVGVKGEEFWGHGVFSVPEK